MTDNKKDPGASFKALVRICGLAILGSVFLPWFGGETLYEFGKFIVDAFGEQNVVQEAVNEITQRSAWDRILDHYTSGSSSSTLLFGIYFLLTPLIFLLGALWMFLSGKYSGNQFGFLLLFIPASWAIFSFVGVEAGIQDGFFEYVGIGLYVAAGAFFLPFLGMFFLDKSV